jgi:hypothetical protein
MLRRVGLGELDQKQTSLLKRGLEPMVELPPVKRLMDDFASTIRLAARPSLSELISALQANRRLDEFLEKLVPLMVERPQRSKQMWTAFASLFRQTTIEEGQVA